MKNYNKDEPISSIVYFDANNLYGGSMSNYLPVGDFKWNMEQWYKEKIMAISNESSKGYKFKCRVKIPVNKHDEFNNFVPMPESIKVKKENLNQWQQENYKESNVSKLICSFDEKIDYVIDYRYLKLCLSLGCELVSVSQVLEYKQEPFLKPYIALNTDLRTKAINEFDKDFLN
jgi:hypothetical protein